MLKGVPWPRHVDLPGPLSTLVSGIGAWFDELKMQPSHFLTWAHDWLVLFGRLDHGTDERRG